MREAPEPVVRAVLTRGRIVHAAVALLERHGPEALSMRAVAAELGVAVMSLYNHVPNKAALMEGVAEYVVAGLDEVPFVDDWRDETRALVRAFRAAAHEYPHAMRVVLSHSIESTAASRLAERSLALAARAGFRGAVAVRIVHALMAYAVGSQLQALWLGQLLDRVADIEVDPARFPHVVASATALLAHDPEADFEFGLDLFISAIDALPRGTG
ncbi:TetR/AcrR family transcriptional regulator [Cryptosporangium phraense]|uniref:TetR/AcrR family transcriptional regulator n=1 Tax=Cryptosporangium phraense TaxID=2593070 RepID=A0A545B0M8_9ACTN|nr:TetR/AcrR family transcriptional regulator C-terminal domain-containing protein [Cryptosporangium phraense]TQS47104.1 TetR/AcrR family transcriptional regulator [Cryptosporangium phraense]